jgi:hypothetical protein
MSNETWGEAFDIAIERKMKEGKKNIFLRR